VISLRKGRGTDITLGLPATTLLIAEAIIERLDATLRLSIQDMKVTTSFSGKSSYRSVSGSRPVGVTAAQMDCRARRRDP
jgi:hypothetical protein